MLKPQAGMTDVRMIQPLSVASLGNIELNLISAEYKLTPTESTSSPKIAIWQRQMLTLNQSIEIIEWALSKGYILISEFDDDPDHWPEIQENDYLAFKGVHAVQTSTRVLRDKILNLNPEVQYFSTCLERLDSFDNEKWEEAKESKQLKIFFGALNRKADWEPLIDSINRSIKMQPDKYFFEVVYDHQFFEALETKEDLHSLK